MHVPPVMFSRNHEYKRHIAHKVMVRNTFSEQLVVFLWPYKAWGLASRPSLLPWAVALGAGLSLSANRPRCPRRRHTPAALALPISVACIAASRAVAMSGL